MGRVSTRFAPLFAMAEIVDLDAFVPPPPTRVRLLGAEYEIKSILDMPYQEYLEILALERRLEGEPRDDQMELIIEQVSRMIPGLDGAVIRRLSLRQLGMLRAVVESSVAREAAESGPLAPDQTESS